VVDPFGHGRAVIALSCPGMVLSPGPVPITAGINRGAQALYLRDPDGFTIELFQPPAR
jgi:hypothetical protein